MKKHQNASSLERYTFVNLKKVCFCSIFVESCPSQNENRMKIFVLETFSLKYYKKCTFFHLQFQKKVVFFHEIENSPLSVTQI